MNVGMARPRGVLAVALAAVVGYLAPVAGIDDAANEADGNVVSSRGVAGARLKPGPGEIVTVAGTGDRGFSGDGGDAREAQLGGNDPTGIRWNGDGMRIDVGADGTVYVADVRSDRVRAIDPDGVITTVVQHGEKYDPWLLRSVAVGPDNTIYGTAANSIFAVSTDSAYPEENLRVIGGAGERDAYGEDGADGGPATEARIDDPVDMAVDADGVIYIADFTNYLIRQIDTDGVITTIAGGGDLEPEDAEGLRATQAWFRWPQAVTADSQGNVYFAVSTKRDYSVVWKVDQDGILTAVAGSQEAGVSGVAGEGGPATEAQLGGDGPMSVTGLAVGPDDSLYLADNTSGLVRKVDTDGVVTTVAAFKQELYDVAVSPDGLVYVTVEDQIKVFDPDAQEPAGNDAGGGAGEVGPDLWAQEEPGTIIPLVGDQGGTHDSAAERARFTLDEAFDPPMDVTVSLVDVTVDPTGALYLAGVRNDDELVVVDELVALGAGGETRDLDAELVSEYRHARVGAVDAYTSSGFYYLANNVARKVYPDGTVAIVAGGVPDLPVDDRQPANVDGRLATRVRLGVTDIAVGPDGAVFVADALRHIVYRLEVDGTLTRMADYSEYVGAQWSGARLAVDGDGGLLVAIPEAHRVARIASDGSVTNVAGNGIGNDPTEGIPPGPEELGDGGPAREAAVRSPSDVAVAPDGSFYIGTHDGVRWVDGDGTITTLDSAVDEKRTDFPMTRARLATDAHGNLYVADQMNGQVWVIVRPHEQTSSPWLAATVWVGGALVVLAGLVAIVVWRRRSLLRRSA